MELHEEGAVQESHGEDAVMEMKRRDFLKGAAFSVLGVSSLGVLGGCAKEETADAEPTTTPVVPTTTPSGTPADIVALGGSTMSIYELNKMRHELVDSKGDYTLTDGTVVPAVWNKLRTLVDSIGWGCGAAKNDTAFDFLKIMFTEEEAQAYLGMPFGVMFTAADYADYSGADEAEGLALLEDLATRGLLWRARRSGVTYFHQVALAHGVYEYNLDHFFDDGWVAAFVNSLQFGAEDGGILNSGTPFYYAIPCDKSVVADESILLHDDFEKIIARNTIIGVSPCQCRMANMVRAGEAPSPAIGTEELKTYVTPTCGHPLETCLSFGEEAAYYIEKNIARPVDGAEALAILRRSVEAGMVIQSCFTKDTEIICSCHSDCCGILGGYFAAGADICAVTNSYPNNSHYVLQYDKTACVKCGSCAVQCPMGSITMDAEGFPAVDAKCMRCGQCGMVCPASARTLAAKAPEDRLELPATLLEDYNLQAAFRFENGWIH